MSGPGRDEPPATWREFVRRAPSRRFGKAVAAVTAAVTVAAGAAVVVFVATGVLF